MQDKVLVIGSGGREHAIVRQLAASPHTPEIFVAPGNPGMTSLAELVDLDPADQPAVAEFCRDKGITLVIIGPEDPLIDGLADVLRENRVAVFGPGAEGARLEGDKEFAKEFMEAAGVPTAAWRSFTDRDEAVAWLDEAGLPTVIKATGAAAGKGVAVCVDHESAVAHIDDCLSAGRFGAAGQRILIEECLSGPELSVLALVDNSHCALLVPSRDHKRVGEKDTGPNTGGMGAFAPVEIDASLSDTIDTTIVQPVLAELRKRDIDYRGVLYVGLMLTEEGPKVLEFNCRFGDPETQVVLPLLAVDFLEIARSVAWSGLGDYLALQLPAAGAPRSWPGAELSQWEKHCVVIVGAAEGYPGAYAKGLDLELPADVEEEAWIIHAGTRTGDSGLKTSGGRVLGAVGLAEARSVAAGRAYGLLESVICEGLFWRRDIAAD